MNKKILVLNDVNVKEALQEAGFVVVDDLNTKDVDAMICEHVKDIRIDVPTIVLTNETDPSSVLQAKQQGAKGYIIKPFKADLLIAAVEKLLQKQR